MEYLRLAAIATLGLFLIGCRKELHPLEAEDWWLIPADTMDSSYIHRASEFLVAAEESRIYDKDNQEHYRFIWLRKFHKPVIFHLTKLPQENAELSVIILSGEAGFEIGEVIEHRSQLISDAELEKFRKMLVATDFWSMPHDRPSNVLDGARWILEGFDGENYQVVNRQGGGSIASLGRWFIENSGLELDKRDIY